MRTPTSLAVLAAGAPSEIPYWYKHESPERPTAPRPPAVLSQNEREAISEFKSDSREMEDMPENLEPWAESWAQYQVDCSAWAAKDAEARYFQWRTYFALSMADHLEQLVPQDTVI